MRKFAWAVGIVLLLWIGAMFFTPAIADFVLGSADCPAPISGAAGNALGKLPNVDCSKPSSTRYGDFGDAFGAINALFAGLALAGIWLMLHAQNEASRRTNKPFVVPRFQRDSGAEASVRSLPHQQGQVRLQLKCSFPVENCSNHPALNLQIALRVSGIAIDASIPLELPLVSQSKESVVVALAFVGEQARKLVAELVGEGAELVVAVRFESIDRVGWASQSKYVLRTVASRPDDSRLLASAIDGEVAVEGVSWGADATVYLDYSTKAGSWSFEEYGVSEK